MTTDEEICKKISEDIYKEPSWSRKCSEIEYGLDVLKNGSITDHIPLTDKPFYIIGRQKDCDMVFEHPSLSRHHAVIQYSGVDDEKPLGWYLLDFKSTHGTILNKKRIEPEIYVRLRTGHVLKFAGSSRFYVVTGPEEDKEEVSKYSWTELQLMKKTVVKPAEEADKPVSNECTWGFAMRDFADPDDCDGISDAPKTDDERYKHEKNYREDPKKVMKWWFEQEGLLEGPQYDFRKDGPLKTACRLELPIYNESGDAMFAEVSGCEKRKELTARCAYEACKMLDAIDELYRDGSTSKTVKKDNKYYQEKDYYSSEDDEFFDRTGRLEEKRLHRMKRFGLVKEDSDSDDEKEEVILAKDVKDPLVKFRRLEEINDEILNLEGQLEKARKEYECDKDDASGLDELEQYMKAIQSGTLSGQGRQKLRSRIYELQKEENLLRKQLKLQIPVTASQRQSLYACKKKETETKQDQKPPKTAAQKLQSIKVPSLRSQQGNERKDSNTFKQTKKPYVEIELESEESDQEDNKDHKAVEANEEDKLESGVNRDEVGTSQGLRKRQIENEDGSREIGSASKKLHLEKRDEDDEIEEEDDDNNSGWVPPSGQSGDGRTALNDKLGY